MKQNEINEECKDLIIDINNYGSNFCTDYVMADHFGLDSHNFTEQDLINLREIHENFINACEDIPDFENVVRFDERIRAPEMRFDKRIMVPEQITQKDVFDYMDTKQWFTIGIDYRHGDELRTAYFRAKSVQNAVREYNKVCTDPILSIFLINEDDVREWKYGN